MPQMMPMFWFLIFLIFLIVMLMIMILIYFYKLINFFFCPPKFHVYKNWIWKW